MAGRVEALPIYRTADVPAAAVAAVDTLDAVGFVSDRPQTSTSFSSVRPCAAAVRALTLIKVELLDATGHVVAPRA